jgi:hypothetical protein
MLMVMVKHMFMQVIQFSFTAWKKILRYGLGSVWIHCFFYKKLFLQ